MTDPRRYHCDTCQVTEPAVDEINTIDDVHCECGDVYRVITLCACGKEATSGYDDCASCRSRVELKRTIVDIALTRAA